MKPYRTTTKTRKQTTTSEQGCVLEATDNGVRPDTGKDCTAAMAALLGRARQTPGATIRLAPGRYDFHAEQAFERTDVQSNTGECYPRRSAIVLDRHVGTTIEGNGAVLMLHGALTALTLDACEGVTLRGIHIDAARLLTSQAKVVELEDDAQVVELDADRFPYEVDDGRFLAVVAGDRAPLFAAMEVDPVSGRNLDGDGKPPERVEELARGQLRFFGGKRVSREGHLLILRHHQRTHAGMFIHGCSDMVVEECELWATAGLGILCQHSKNLTFHRTHVRPRPNSGLFCGPKDDGFQVSGCRGHVEIDGCHVSGTADDPINIHGLCLPVLDAPAPNRVVAHFPWHKTHAQPLWARPGNEIVVLARDTLLPVLTNTVREYHVREGGKVEIVFERPFESPLTSEHVIENLTDTPSVHIHDCLFENNRARGILCSSPERVVIEDNVFRVAGAAVLIAGDANKWFETGAVHDVTIRGNRFENCLISPTEFSDGVIAVWPTIPRDVPGRYFHSNITIEDNTFLTFGGPLLYAHNVDGLHFCRNRIVSTTAFPDWHPIQEAVWLRHVHDVVIEGNKTDGVLPATGIAMEKEEEDAVRVAADDAFGRELL